jgi:hypothetical protein
VVAVVALSDGTFIKASKSVKVTIGGCGWFYSLMNSVAVGSMILNLKNCKRIKD